MPLYTRESVERLKETVDVVSLVGARTDLRRVGGRQVGLCPFHDERTPSFSVNPELGLYHCFGCGESGDAIKFVQATEGLDFREAVELLADRYGVELKAVREDPRAEERRRRKERLLRLVERTAAYYARYLWDSEEAAKARTYLGGRGLGDDVLRDFRVGYAPSAWDRVLLAAQRDGFGVEEIAAAGLGQRGGQGGFYDRFRGRIMFPLADPRGRVLGFGARALREDQRPKYLNTSENELYHKGRQLFGMDRARARAAKIGSVVVVEGYTDVLALHQAGVQEAVAIMGTALTPEQVAELARAAPMVYMALDADRSGQDAMLRAARASASRGLELRVVAMPDGKDPADLVAAEGPEAFTSLLERAMAVPEFEVRRVLSDADLETPGGRDRALAAVRPLLATVPERTATRDELVRLVADRLDVPPSYATSELSAAGGAVERMDRAAPDRVAEESRRKPALDMVARRERTFLAMCIAEPGLGERYLKDLTDDHLTSEPLRQVRSHLLSHLHKPLSDLPDDPTLAGLIAGIVTSAEEEPTSEPTLRVCFLQLERERIDRALRTARNAGNLTDQRELSARRDDVQKQTRAVMGEAV